MAFVKRDERGAIVAVSREAASDFSEALPDDHPDLLAFLKSVGNYTELAQTDLDFVRVLEDLLEVLMDKSVLLFTELPEEAQAKIMQRRALRRGDKALDLLDDDLRL